MVTPSSMLAPLTLERQGAVKAPTGQRILYWSRPWNPDPDALLRRRILDLLSTPGPSRDARWSWWQLRVAVGGRTPIERVRAAVDASIDAGDVVEVWVARVGRQQPRHLLILTTDWGRPGLGEVIAARGQERIVQEIAR